MELPDRLARLIARGRPLADDVAPQWLAQRFNWTIHAYCLMSNHYHLLVETPDANLAKGMRQLNGVHTQAFNRVHQRVGHVFQDRYKAILVEKEAHLLELARYVVRNPVRAAMVATPGEWPWSSYRAMVGKECAPDWLATREILTGFGETTLAAVAAYVRFVTRGNGASTTPWENVKHQVFLGSDVFVDAMRNHLSPAGDLASCHRPERGPYPSRLLSLPNNASTGTAS